MSEHGAVPESSAFRQYYDELLGFLTAKLGCRDQAADVVQDTYVRVLSVESSQAIIHPRAFLYRTALNLTVDLFRVRQRREAGSVELDAVEHLPSDVPDQENVVDAKQRLALLHQAIRELPPKCRHVFLLHKFKELSHGEIAERLGISKNMVEKHVMKALAHCRIRLDQDLRATGAVGQVQEHRNDDRAHI
jgi:RNA polymerase sigma-70 factor (ECF subfamily)